MGNTKGGNTFIQLDMVFWAGGGRVNEGDAPNIMDKFLQVDMKKGFCHVLLVLVISSEMNAGGLPNI